MTTASLRMPRRAFRELEIDQIELNDFDLRSDIDHDALAGMAETINKMGTLQPILVSLNSKTKRYQVILGGRRVRAAKHAQELTIPAFIVDDLPDDNALVMMLIENMQREDLEPLEESRGMAELRDRFKFNEQKIASIIGKRLQFVRERLALLELPGEIKAQLVQGRLGVSQAIPITRIAGKEKTQLAIASEAEDKGLTAEVVARMVNEATRKKRRYKKITRKHKLKKSGDPLGEAHMDKKIQQTVLRGEQLLNMLDSFPMNRWSPEKAEQLRQAVVAVEQGLQQVRRKITQRAGSKE